MGLTATGRLIKTSYSLVLMLSLGFWSPAQPVIQNILGHKPLVGAYEKMEWRVQLSASFTNPYDYQQVSLEGIFIDPDGDSVRVDGFYMQDFTLVSESSGAISPTGQEAFRLRFASSKPGQWQYYFRLTDKTGQAVSAVQGFTCQDSQQRGFIRRLNDRYLGYADGTLFIPVGENVGWHQNNPYTDYRQWLSDLRLHGGNFYRLWQCHWGLGLEWRSGQGYEGLRRYHQANAYYLDQLFTFSDEQGLYLLWALQHHGQVSTQVNPNWSESPYNLANGGPCAHTWDFFTQPAALDHTFNRYRYILARWGHHRCIAAWELFNEVDWTDEFGSRRDAVANWHATMARFLRDHDPYRHLITTSYAQDQYDPQVWQHQLMDFTQTHYYPQVSNPEKILAAGIKKYAVDFGKPTLNGEFGITTTGVDLTATDRQGIHLHNCLWASLFSGAVGTGLTWWWDNYVAPNNLYYHFEGIGKLATQLIQPDFRPAVTEVQGAPAQLIINPAVGWAGRADTLIHIAFSGTTQPVDVRLGQYLYGAIWNTQYRQPPVFEVDLLKPSRLSVLTGPQTGQAARIAFWLDGVKISDQPALVNQTYLLEIPAGRHRIMVDNTGTDWITIKSYAFSGLGTQVEAYVLSNPAGDRAAGWLLNNIYNHDYLRTQGQPPAVSKAQLTIPTIKKGGYRLDWYNSLTGVLIRTEQVNAGEEGLTFNVPDLRWDLVFELRETTVAVPSAINHLSFDLFPNPVANGIFHLRWNEQSEPSVEIIVYDHLGRVTSRLTQTVPLQPIPGPKTAGLYWIKVIGRQGSGIKAMLVSPP